jgi:hypothetical protein
MLLGLAGCKEELYFIPGTGTLPDCDEAPIADLGDTLWFDQGTVTIRSEGCADAMPNDEFESCALNWAFSQTGNDLSIVVDEEYKLEGRLCGDQLYLRGGWWLPVKDENDFCYEDDSAEEVGIQAEGNVLTVSTEDQQINGTLVVQGPCTAEYAVTFEPVRDPSL